MRLDTARRPVSVGQGADAEGRGSTEPGVCGILVPIGILLAALPKDWLEEERLAIEPAAGNGFVELLPFVVPLVVGAVLMDTAGSHGDGT